VFHPDLYGAQYSDTGDDGETHDIDLPAVDCLPALIDARPRYAHGAQTDLFDDPHAIGFIRHGTDQEPGCIVMMSNGDTAEKAVDLGADHAGARFHDLLGHCTQDCTADDEGRVTLYAPAGGVSVWVRAETVAAVNED
jgi:alpha-amylase